MRIILYTGKGGVGKTSIAAATALRCADLGQKTLVASTDPAHSLGDSFDMELSGEPAQIGENLWAQEIDSAHEMRKNWGQVQTYLSHLFASQSIDGITADELIAFPGIDSLLSLLRISGYCKSGEYETIIVDCAPTGETLSLLSCPEMLKWWMERIFPMQKKMLKVLRPVSKPVLGVELPSGSVMDEIEQLYYALDEIKSILSDRSVISIRLVVNPEKMVIKEARRSFTYLSLYDFGIDAVVVNKIMPENAELGCLTAWRDMQSGYRRMIAESFSPIPLLEVPLLPSEVVGRVALESIAADLFKDSNPADIKYSGKAQRAFKEEGRSVLSIDIPFVEKEKLSLNLKGDELIVTAGPIKRYVALPQSYIKLEITGAKFENGTLKIYFGGSSDEK